MIISNDGEELTPLQAAKRLFFDHGAAIDGMRFEDFDLTLHIRPLTNAEKKLIRKRINALLPRMTKQLWQLRT